LRHTKRLALLLVSSGGVNRHVEFVAQAAADLDGYRELFVRNFDWESAGTSFLGGSASSLLATAVAVAAGAAWWRRRP